MCHLLELMGGGGYIYLSPYLALLIMSFFSGSFRQIKDSKAETAQ